MKPFLTTLALILTVTMHFTARSQPVLSLDFDARSGTPDTTFPGFERFVIGADTGSPTTRTYGSISVTLAPFGAGATYDDRLRPTPANSGDFTQSLLLRDFVFCGSSVTGTGQDILIEGLTAGVTYQFTIWSYDVSSTGNRVSDWSANGVPVIEDYVFNGSVTPVSDSQYQFSFKAPASPAGQVSIEGRRDAATSSSGSVFINALQVEESTPDSPPGAFTIEPLIAAVAESGTVTFRAVAMEPGALLLFQWQRSDGLGGFTNVAGATSSTYTTPPLLLADSGSEFRCEAINLFGSVTSTDVATVTVFEDSEPPTVINVQTAYPYTQLVVAFSEPVETISATDAFNYYLEVNGQVNWSSVSLLDDSTVLLVLDRQFSVGNSYELYITSVQDRAPIPNLIEDAYHAFTVTSRLGIDFDRRGNAAGMTQFGFNSFEIESEGGATLIQTNPTTRAFGAITVTMSGAGENPGYDDRLRASPVDGGDFTESLLLQDFVFSRSSTPGEGLDILVEGLTAGETYQFTVWSFDSGSPNNRVSDWSVNGYLLHNYTFNGSALPTDNAQSQFSFKITAPPSGQVLISAAIVSGGLAAFINGLWVEPTTADAPIVTQSPSDLEVWAGANAIFSAALTGTAPISFQWQKDGGDIPGATNRTLVLFDVQVGDVGDYALVVSNGAGTDTSAAATLTVNPVANVATALISYWPLDELTDITPDVTANMNHLMATNMGSTNLVSGRFGQALTFNGTDQLLFRGHTNSTGLPLYDYSSYTVSMWVKGDFTNQLDRRVFSEASTTNASSLLNLGTDNLGTNGTVNIYIRNDDGAVPVNHQQSGLIAFDDDWHHIAWIDNNGYGRIYVDGAQDTNEINYPRGTLSPDLLSVGGIVRTEPSHWFAGAIDDVAVWGRALSSAEVQQVMAFGPLRTVKIAQIELADGNVVLSLSSSMPASAHVVEETSDPANPSWSEVLDVNFSAPVGDQLTATFAMPADGQKFYRVSFSQ